MNQVKGFESQFLSFKSGARMEIMRTTAFSPIKYERAAQRMGLTHLAFAIGSEPIGRQGSQPTGELRETRLVDPALLSADHEAGLSASVDQ